MHGQFCSFHPCRILDAEGKGRFQAFPAGSHPKGEVHPWALKTLDALGYTATGFSSKGWYEAGSAVTRTDTSRKSAIERA